MDILLRGPKHHPSNYISVALFLIAGVGFVVFFQTQLGTLPPPVIVLVFLMQIVLNSAEILPRSQTTLATILRIIGLALGFVGFIIGSALFVMLLIKMWFE